MKKSQQVSFPLIGDATSRFAPLTLSLLVFIATLALIITFMVNNLLQEWQHSLGRTLSVHVPPDFRLSAEMESRKIKNLVQEIQRIAGILQIERLENNEVKDILQPWFSGGDTLDFMPLPTIINITLDAENPVDMDKLRTIIRNIDPDAILDDHAIWQRQLLVLFRGIQSLCLLVMIVMLGAVSIIVFLVAHSSMSHHLEVVDVMQVVGAQDDLVVGVFQRRAFKLGVLGTLVGTSLGVAAIIGVDVLIGNDITVALKGEVAPSVLQWMFLPLFAVMVLLLMRFVTGRAVRSFLDTKW